MTGIGKARQTIETAAEKVLAAAGDTKNAILGLGAGLVVVALIALAALILSVRAGRKVIA